MIKSRFVEEAWANKVWANKVVVAMVAVMVLSAAFLLSARPAQAQTTLPCVVSYTVQPGDWIARIGRQYGVNPSAILAFNPQIKHPNLIYPGQVIQIPLCGQAPPYVPPPTNPGTGGQPPAATCRYWHWVAPGQTMFGIARQYSVDPWAIARANGILNLNRIYSGTNLCIP